LLAPQLYVDQAAPAAAATGMVSIAVG